MSQYRSYVGNISQQSPLNKGQIWNFFDINQSVVLIQRSNT